MRRTPIFASLTGILLGILACNAPDIPLPGGTLDPLALATIVEGQLQTLVPELASTQAASATSTPSEAACEPQPPAALDLPLPSGIAAAVTDAETVELITFEGNTLQTRDAPGLVFEEPGYLHVAGPISQGPFELPVVYYALENGGWLKVNMQGGAAMLAQAPMTVAIAGAARGTFIVYSNYESATTGWISHLYAGDLDGIAGAAPLMTRDEGDGYVFFPIAIRSVDGQAEGIWYTLSLYGIGNIIFPPYRGIYYYDLETNQITAFLGFDYQFSSLSPDQTWLAYTMGSSAPQPGIHLRNMITCAETYIPLDATSTLGAGYVAFSPDNSKVAWIEASGDVMAEVDLLVRVASTTGAIVAQAPMDNLYGLAGGEELSWIVPVGWVSNDQVLYEMALLDWSGLVLARAEADFHVPIPLGIDRAFMGFYYP